MNEHILTLEKAKSFVAYPEMFLIFWADWHIITEVEYDALEYLVQYSSRINLPNVKSLTDDKIELLKNYKGHLVIGVKNINT